MTQEQREAIVGAIAAMEMAAGMLEDFKAVTDMLLNHCENLSAVLAKDAEEHK